MADVSRFVRCLRVLGFGAVVAPVPGTARVRVILPPPKPSVPATPDLRVMAVGVLGRCCEVEPEVRYGRNPRLVADTHTALALALELTPESVACACGRAVLDGADLNVVAVEDPSAVMLGVRVKVRGVVSDDTQALLEAAGFNRKGRTWSWVAEAARAGT